MKITMEDSSSKSVIKEEDKLEIKQEEVNFELTEEAADRLSYDSIEHITIKTELPEEESDVPNGDFEQILIKTEERFLPENTSEDNVISNKKIVESDGMEVHNKEDQTKTLEFTYVKADQEDEKWEEYSAHEPDPLAISTAVEITVEPLLMEEDDDDDDDMDTTDATASTSQDAQFDNPYGKQKHFTGCGYTTSKCKRIMIQADNEEIQYEKIVFNNDTQSRRQKKPKPLQIGENLFRCTFCDYSLPVENLRKLKRHIKQHLGETTYKCTLCSYCTTESSKIKVHVRVHTGERPFKCTVCDYSAADASKVKVHMRVHTGEKPYKCTICNYSSSFSSSVKRHIRTHTEEKPFKCTECDYCSTDSSNLRQHMRLHTGETPYKCTMCDYSTIDASRLRQHQRVHTGERPYKCTICDYSSSYSSTFKRHMRVHTGERPYKCDECGFCFADSGSLKKHVVLHTGKKP